MHNHHNGLKTALLFGFMWGLLLLIGGGISFGTRNSIWIFIFAVIGLGQTFYSYWNSDKLALRSMQAYPVTEAQAPHIYRIVRELSLKAEQPMPNIYISPTKSPNAFATGRNPQNAAVCCTEGILDLLNERELRGVLGHELMHVYNRDILTSSVAAAMGGVISSIAHFALYFGSSGRDREERGGGGIIFSLLAALLAPLAAMFIQLAISRTREYDADEDGARLTGDPLALASALRKLEAGTNSHPLVSTPKTEQVAAMMIANPFGSIARFFSTHPPMDQRIARLEAMAEAQNY